VVIELNSQGTENAMAFSLSFDPKVWQWLLPSPDGMPNAHTLLVNEAEAAEGRLGFVLALQSARS